MINFGKVKMSFHYSEIEALAGATIGQHPNIKWYNEREGRILASSMRDTIELGQELQQHNMRKDSKLSEELLQKIRWRRKCLYNYKDFSYRGAVKWGFEKGSHGSNILCQTNRVSSRTNGNLGFSIWFRVLLSRWIGLYFTRNKASQWNPRNKMSLQT